MIKEIVESVFPADIAKVCIGGVDVAVSMSKLPLNHLFFTGSVAVGKKVMSAAAERLTPITLELGGKSPAVIHPSYNMAKAADRIVFGKCLNAGQTCIAPDYVLCPKDKVPEFVSAFEAQVKRRFVSLKDNKEYTAIVNAHHRNRLLGLLDDAASKGANVISVNPGGEDLNVKLAPTLVLNTSDEMTVMTDEIFGPILPVVPYDTLDDAIAYINDRPRPLALYYFDTRQKRIEQVLNETVSGSVCVNETMIQFTQDELPFGGVGPSGLGRYKGRYGFETFSHMKPVLKQSRFTMVPESDTTALSRLGALDCKTIIGR